MRIYARLVIISKNVSVEHISSSLQMQPDKKWEIGEIQKYRVKPANDNGWVLDSKVSKKAVIEDHVEGLKVQLKDKKEALKKLSEDCVINTIFSIYSEESPPTFFESDFIKFLGDINASLDIDLYYFD